MCAGRIWLDRKILDWEWWDDINTFRLFTYCLLRANWKESKFHGIDVPRGAFVTSVSTLSKETGLTFQQVRTALNHLKSTCELTIKSHSKFSVVIVNSYNHYQDINTVDNNKITDNQQATQQTDNKQVTTEEESNKEKKKKDIYSDSEKEVRHVYGEYHHVKLTDTEYNRLVSDYGEKAVLDGIKNVDEYCQQKGKTYKDYNLTIRKWGIKSPKLEKKPIVEEEEPEHEMTDEEWVEMVKNSDW